VIRCRGFGFGCLRKPGGSFISAYGREIRSSFTVTASPGQSPSASVRSNSGRCAPMMAGGLHLLTASSALTQPAQHTETDSRPGQRPEADTGQRPITAHAC
jgi:hypothetical protein